MARVTQRELVETILALQSLATSIRKTAGYEPLEDTIPASVPLPVSFLVDTATFLDQVVGELQTLIPDKPASSPTKK